MKFPFYRNEDKTYTIDDANIDCGRIIVSWCDGSHRYATLCELIEDCPGIKQLTRPCIVDALNDLQTLGQQSGLSPEKRFLRIWADGCLEVANPCICNDWDKYVIATDDDNDPGPLSTKVRWSCSDDGLYCIDIEVGWPKTLVWRPSGPNGPFINADLPTCQDVDSAYVKMKKTWGKWKVDYECENVDSGPQYLYAYHTGWQTVVDFHRTAWWSLRYYAIADQGHAKPSGTESYFTWWWSISATEAFERTPNSSYGVFRIIEPGIYAITFSTYVSALWYANTWHAIRAGLYKSNGWNWFEEMWDVKYEASDVTDWINRMHPQNWDRWLFWYGWTIDFSSLPFARTYIVNVVNVPVDIAYCVKPECDSEDARRLWTAVYWLELWWVEWWPYSANASIEVVKMAESLIWWRYREI